MTASPLSRWVAAAGAAVTLVATLVIGAPAHADHVAPRGTAGACPVHGVSPTVATGFRDVTGYVFTREINCLTDYGVARGRQPGSYAPGEPVLRRQMALFLSRIVERAGRPLPTAPAGFTDVAGLDAATRNAINAVANLGIARGTGAGQYAPDAHVTRAQMATFLANLHAALTGVRFPSSVDHFDGDTGVHEASINAIASAGIGVGTGADRDFGPSRPVTRGQMAGFLGRLLDIEVGASQVPSVFAPHVTYDPAALASSAGIPCSVIGTEGDDVLTGTPGRDVLCGLGGDDVLTAMQGDDVLDGGPGVDQLLGGDGDDDLDGGSEHDEVDGGIGLNWCVPESSDVLEQCRYDLDRPTVEYLAATPGTVDARTGVVTVVAQARLLDDTGVVRARVLTEPANGNPGTVFGPMTLVSGTPRDGVWQSTAVVRQDGYSGAFDLTVEATDRLRRTEYATFAGALRVTGTSPDTQDPVVQSLSVTSSTGSFPVDVRHHPGQVTVEARITDDRSGVGMRPTVCPWVRQPPVDPAEAWRHPFGPTNVGCVDLERASGDPNDGVYRGALHLPVNALTGEYDVQLVVKDAVNLDSDVRWLGPGLHRQLTEFAYEPTEHLRLLPGGAGPFSVLGVEGDSEAPRVLEARMTPPEVDTLNAEQTVEVLVHAVDAGTDPVGVVGAGLVGVTEDGSILVLEGSETRQLHSGTAADGWWRLELTLPQGTPPGAYHLHTYADDIKNRRAFVSPGSPYSGSLHMEDLPQDVMVTVIDTSG